MNRKARELLERLGEYLYNDRFIYRDRYQNVLIKCEDSLLPSFKKLAPFTSYWLGQLDLGEKHCMIKSYINPEIPSGHRLDGAATLASLVAKDGSRIRFEVNYTCSSSRPSEAYIKMVGIKDFDLIIILLEARSANSLKSYLDQPCPICRKHKHIWGRHAILHELVHVAYPEYSCDNEWTDRRVEELFLSQPGRFGEGDVPKTSYKGKGG